MVFRATGRGGGRQSYNRKSTHAGCTMNDVQVTATGVKNFIENVKGWIAACRRIFILSRLTKVDLREE